MTRADIIMLAQLALNTFLVALVLYRDWKWRLDREGFALACTRLSAEELKTAETFVDDGRRRYHAGRASAFKAVAGVLRQKETDT